MNVPRFIRRLFRRPYDGLQHLRTVEEGVLYRCGQPTPEQLAELISRYKLRTVVCLRGSRDPDDPDAWERSEREVCEAGGARFIPIPFNHKNPPTAAQVDQFLACVSSPESVPALVHCRIGQQRTGLFCALFRVRVQGVVPDVALREMDELGFNSGHRRHQRLFASFREHVERLAGGKRSAS